MNDETFREETPLDPMAGTNGAPGGPLRKVVLAGIGAIAEACDTAEQRFDEFANRGERVREEWTERADELRRERSGARGRARDYFRSAMDTLLDTFNVPNKTDVDTINVKLNILTRKIDDLQMEAMESNRPASAAADGTPPVA